MQSILHFTCIFIALHATPAFAQPSDKTPDFDTDVLPILIQHCILCHGPGKQESNYRVDRVSTILSSGSSKLPPVTPGDPLKSHLWQRVASNDSAVRMPPKGQGLSQVEKATIRDWIEEGAKPSATTVTNPNTDHWSFQAIQNPTPPHLNNQKLGINEVDAFIQAKLETNSLSLSNPADRYTLIRRVYLVMLGLQPTEAEIVSFINDKAPEAYERLVEQVLASPHYGERWAQHWLDCVRYAESTGYEINSSISNICFSHYLDSIR